MPSKRDISLSKYDISKERYRELYYFCQQYKEKKERLKDCYSIGSPSLSDTPKGGCTSDVVARQAENAMKLEKDIEALEQCAVAADPEIYQYVIKSVTEGVKYEFLKVPASRKKFYRARRKFFYLLDQKKG